MKKNLFFTLLVTLLFCVNAFAADQVGSRVPTSGDGAIFYKIAYENIESVSDSGKNENIEVTSYVILHNESQPFTAAQNFVNKLETDLASGGFNTTGSINCLYRQPTSNTAFQIKAVAHNSKSVAELAKVDPTLIRVGATQSGCERFKEFYQGFNLAKKPSTALVSYEIADPNLPQNLLLSPKTSGLQLATVMESNEVALADETQTDIQSGDTEEVTIPKKGKKLSRENLGLAIQELDSYRFEIVVTVAKVIGASYLAHIGVQAMDNYTGHGAMGWSVGFGVISGLWSLGHYRIVEWRRTSGLLAGVHPNRESSKPAKLLERVGKQYFSSAVFAALLAVNTYYWGVNEQVQSLISAEVFTTALKGAGSSYFWYSASTSLESAGYKRTSLLIAAGSGLVASLLFAGGVNQMPAGIQYVSWGALTATGAALSYYISNPEQVKNGVKFVARVATNVTTGCGRAGLAAIRFGGGASKSVFQSLVKAFSDAAHNAFRRFN